MTMEFKLGINKKIILGLVLFVIAVIFSAIFLSGEKVESRVFGGKIIKVEGNNVSLEGFYMIDDGTEYAILGAESNTEKRTVTAKITSKTQFIKTVFAVPDLELGQMFRPSELNRETMPGSLEEIEKEKPGIFVTASKNIFDKRIFEIIKVEYVIPIFPDEN